MTIAQRQVVRFALGILAAFAVYSATVFPFVIFSGIKHQHGYLGRNKSLPYTQDRSAGEGLLHDE